MYIPSAFREKRVDEMHGLIRAHPLGLLVTHGPQGLQASPVPFVIYSEEGQHGVLRAHLAKANPHGKELGECLECLVVFQGLEGYITPSWYPTKSINGKVVPTWNYATVHAWGKPEMVADDGWLSRQIDDLTRSHEGRRPLRWSTEDAPADFLAAQRQALIGIEIHICRIEGKWKMSQNRNDADRVGVIDGLRADDDPHRHPLLADLVESRSRRQAEA